MGSRKPSSNWSGRLAIGILSACLAIGAAELWCRFWWIKPLNLGAGIEDPHFHHRLKPSQTYRFVSPEFDVEIRTNRYGLRGPNPVLPKPAGVTRILMLGDSFTFGFPVKDEETFCALIEQGLRAQGEAVEVINGGVSAYSPVLHYLSLRDQFLAFEPDLVILWYDLGDPADDAWFQRNLLYDQTGRILRCDPRYLHGHLDVWEWLKTQSQLTKFLDTTFARAIYQLRAQRPRDRAVDEFLLVRDSSTEARIKPHWDLSMRYVLMIRDLLAERHIPFLLGIYPYGMVVGPHQWDHGRALWGFERGKTYDASLALALFERFSATEHIPLINTFESFRAAAKTEQLFYDRDGHFKPAGHRVLAAHVLQDPRLLAFLRDRSSKSSR